MLVLHTTLSLSTFLVYDTCTSRRLNGQSLAAVLVELWLVVGGAAAGVQPAG
jgi:hypothetical protein